MKPTTIDQLPLSASQIAEQMIKFAGIRKNIPDAERAISRELEHGTTRQRKEDNYTFDLRNGRRYLQQQKDNTRKVGYCTGQDQIEEMKRFRQYIRSMY